MFLAARISWRRAAIVPVAAGFLKLAVFGSIAGSVPVAGAPSSDEIADERTDTEGDAYGLIRMLVHGLVGGLGALDCSFAYPAINLSAAFQRGGEALAGVVDFFPGDVGGGGH